MAALVMKHEETRARRGGLASQRAGGWTLRIVGMGYIAGDAANVLRTDRDIECTRRRFDRDTGQAGVFQIGRCAAGRLLAPIVLGEAFAFGTARNGVMGSDPRARAGVLPCRSR